MLLNETRLSLSATDLSNFLGCRHRTALDMAVAYGNRPKNPRRPDPVLEMLYARGLEHEQRYVDSLKAAGREIVNLADLFKDRRLHVARTLEAMRDGADVIVQGALSDGCWIGLPDIMQRIDTPSALGNWSYEISDTKLARETRAGTILQLGLYSEMLRQAQGLKPEFFHVITPDPVTPKHTYRIDDYAAYFRWMRGRMQDTVALGFEAVAEANYPEPVDHCAICPWCHSCQRRWVADDHLCLVAGITRLQRRELVSHHVTTLAELAAMPLPLQFKPARGSVDSYERVREQARMQFESRGKTTPLHKLRELAEGMGFGRLPEPSPGDLFLDLEGDQFAAEGGREYLFGIISIGADGTPAYRSYWGFTEHEERVAFESVMDLITDTIAKYPGMHVYHYAPYEPSAFKRLMGRYATREDELDRMLRAGRLVDLYHVVRQALIAGVERYSIKNLEVFYAFGREVNLADANRNLRIMEKGLELKAPEIIPQEVRDAVEGYNRDDCVSTLKLRDWLESLRTELEATGVVVPRPVFDEGDPSPELDERAQRVEALRSRLLAGVPELHADRTNEQQARWLVAYMLDFHRREDKAGWWEYYRLRDLPEEDLFDEPAALAGMTHVKCLGPVISAKTGKPTKSVIDRYHYPVQEMEIDPGDELKLQDETTFGKVVAVDRNSRTIDIEKGPSRAAIHPTAVFVHCYISTAVQEAALFRLGEVIADEGSMGEGKAASFAAARDLLLRRPPRLSKGIFDKSATENIVDFAVKVGGELDHTVLAIQGPPGAGKTYAGARMIRALIAQGKRVGVTANSHKVILNLLHAVAEAPGPAITLGHKGDDDMDTDSPIAFFDKNEEALAYIRSPDARVLGGTSWLWAREDFVDSVDVLFVDEAGQMSLANVLAVSGAAKSIVLLGDPQQLDQPQKGSHPDGVNVSALGQVLGDHQTMPSDLGIFLPETWRMHPDLCAFTSELFYENRLASREGLEKQRLDGASGMNGSGLWFIGVDHDGNRNSSMEEVDAVAELIADLVTSGASWMDRFGESRPLTTRDILVVSPYNAQVTRLIERLGLSDVRVGTVDKFQGQEAPVVIFSAATSRPEDAPRGMEFLYSPNRLNVATSRARCASFLVASPRLFEPDCKTPRQMKLANAFCRYRELARLANVSEVDLAPV
ncbi:MAG: TM0106 family RecB-like putative nuclease [Gemmatimonadales bacterium]